MKLRTTGVIRIVNQRTDNTMTKGKRDKKTYNDLQRTKQKTKDQAPQTPLNANNNNIA